MSKRVITSVIYVVVLGTFFLPWASVSCSGTEFMQVSGTDLVFGFEEPPEVSEATGPGEDSVSGEIWAILAALFAIAGIVLALVPLGVRSRYFVSGAAALGVLSLIILKFKLEGDLRSEAGSEFAGMLQLNWEIGYWAAILGFVAAIGPQFIPIGSSRSGVGGE